MKFGIFISAMEFVTTNKGQQKLCYQGYLFIRQKDLANGAVGWECEGRRLERCPGRAKTCEDELISQLNEHTHGPDPTRNDVVQVTSSI